MSFILLQTETEYQIRIQNRLTFCVVFVQRQKKLQKKWKLHSVCQVWFAKFKEDF